MLNFARQAWENSGHNVVGVALASVAARGLQRGAGIESRTIASLLSRLNWEDELRQKGEDPPAILNDKSVVVMDEAGMVGTRQMERVIREVSKAGAKLVLVGDQKQLQSIEHGGAFAALANEIGSCRLSQVMRQKDLEHATAIGKIAKGQVLESFEYYSEKGLLHVADGHQQAKTQMLKTWRKSGGDIYPANHLMLAARRVDVRELNHKAQEIRLEAGDLSARSIQLGKDKIRVGDRIVFTMNSPKKKFDVGNGQFAVVTNMDENGKTITVKLDDEEGENAIRKIKLKEYDHIQLGYAVTTHKSQGMTTEHCYVLTDEAMQDRELSYVQFSRAKQSTNVFTTEEQAGEKLTHLAKRMARSQQEELAISSHDHWFDCYHFTIACRRDNHRPQIFP